MVTVYNMTTGSITFTKSGTYPTLSPTGGTLSQSVTNTCSSTTTGKFIINSSTSTLASNLAAAITACNSSYPAVGVTAVQDGTNTSQVDLSADTAGTAGITLADSVGNFSWTGTTLGGGLPAATVGAGMYPAKYSFSTTTASCTDFVVYNTGLAGSGSQANVVAYDNIYSGCSGTVPSVYWAYNTGTGKAVTSTVLSFEGAQVAFIENPSSGAAVLRILKWVSGQGTDYKSPVAPDHSYTNTYAGASSQTAWNATNCPSGSSCMISVAFQSPRGNQDTISSPWYDYASDTIYVGDSAGYLHKFTGVFYGTPGELTNTSGGTCGTSCVWPVNSGIGPLTSPVYDNTHALVFLGNNAAKLASVNSSTGALVQSTQVGLGLPDISEAPLVDPAASKVYVFVNCAYSSGSGYCLSTSSAVYQFPIPFTSGTTPAEEAMGGLSDGSTPLYQGTFDNAYFTSTQATPTGKLWVCGNTGGTPTLYAITIASNSMTGVVSGPAVSNATTTCSPVTEFCTTSTGAACSTGDTSGNQHDYIFVSPQTLNVKPVRYQLHHRQGLRAKLHDLHHPVSDL